MKLRKQNSSTHPLQFMLVSSTDHVTPLTGATPNVQISKNGGAFGAPVGAVSEISNGWYQITGNATDSNTLGPLLIHATATGGDPSDEEFQIVGFDPDTAWPANFSSLSIDGSGRVDVGKILGTASTGAAGYVGIDWAQVNNPATTVNLSSTTIRTISGNVNGGILGGGVLTFNAPGVLAYIAGTDTTAIDVAAIKTQTDKIGTNAADSTNEQAAQTTIASNLNATVSSRLAASSYLAPDNSDISLAITDLAILVARADTSANVAAIKSVTDELNLMIVSNQFTVSALANAPGGGGSGSAGTGNIVVNQNTGGTNNLSVTGLGGQGIDQASITAYLTSDWTANPLTAPVRGQSFTKADGTWATPMMLDAGAYTFVMQAPGYQSSIKTATVS